jgi:hypothetical protein
VATRIWPDAHTAMARAARTAVAPLTVDTAGHLLSRFSFGPTAADRDWVAAQGPDAWWSAQVAAGKALSGYRGVPSVAAVGPLLDRQPAAVRAWLKAAGTEYGWQAMDQLGLVTLGLQAFSPAQLYETVVDFFANHLNVANHNGDVWHTRHTMDRDVIRAHAFGTYSDMLLASSRNPAMLVYLSLASSKKTAVNENYGRELLELHTVGIEAGYTEDEVKNSARILTGRSLDADFDYAYRPQWHWTGPITVLGFSHANATAEGGEAAGDAYLRYLAAHPSTARRLARKLCLRFVSDAPSATLVEAVAQAYLSSGTNILSTLSAIVRSDEFWASRGAKIRRPTENLLATVRILGNRPNDTAKALNTLNWMTSVVGHRPLDWPSPDGYPDVAGAWRSSATLLTLWEFHRGFAQSWWDGFAPLNCTTLYGSAKPRTSGEAVDALTRRLTGASFSAPHRLALQRFLGEPATTPIAKSMLRWLLPHLVPLILDGPHHALR